MTRSHLTLLTAATIVAVGVAGPADAGGSFAIGISNNGVSVGFGTSNWGIWGSSWDSGGPAMGFSATLAGYGEWIRVDGLGRVWRPWVAAGWQPYTHGRWVWTSLGWTWVAYEPWGWVPHHYGNWAFSTVGWVWSPGYVYHPGNVVWVRSGVHVGWYPCAPRGWSHYHRGTRRGWNSGYASGYADGWRDARYATWVPWSRLDTDNVAHYAVRGGADTHRAARTGVVAMTAPPTRTEVERRVGRPIPEARIVERKTTIDGRDVRVVRPEGRAPDVKRYGAETVERALGPAARKRVSGDTRAGDRASVGRASSIRRSDSAAAPGRSQSTGTIPRRAAPVPARSGESRSKTSKIAFEPGTGRSRSFDRSGSGVARPPSASPVESRKRAAPALPGRVVGRRNPAPVKSSTGVRSSTARSSSRPPAASPTVRRSRLEPKNETASDRRRSGSRSTSDPAKGNRRQSRNKRK